MVEAPDSRIRQQLTASQQEMVRVWERHMKAEFVDHDVDATMATMTEEPYNIAMPVAGSVGTEAVREFYSAIFLCQLPDDMQVDVISRTVGSDRIVDEILLRLTHSIQVDWLLPGVPPTNRRVTLPLVVIVEFRDGKIAGERIYWDHAALLAQVNLIGTESAPSHGGETIRTLLQVSGAVEPAS